MPKKVQEDPYDGKHKRLRQMRCFEEFDRKVCAGISPDVIAAWLQDDMDEHMDITHGGLVKAIKRYRKDVPPERIVKDMPLHVRQTIDKLKRGVNEVVELEALYLLQLKRISIDVQTEEKINKLFSGTGREIEIAGKMLGQMIEMKQKLGIIDMVVDKTEITHTGAVATVQANADLNMSGLSEDDKIKLGKLSERLVSGILDRMAEPKDSSAGSDTIDME